jgi:hypothetical protein
MAAPGLGCEQFRPGKRAGLVLPPAAGVCTGLPDTGGPAARRVNEHHDTAVPHFFGTELYGPAGVRGFFGHGTGIIRGKVDIPLRRRAGLLLGRVLRCHNGHEVTVDEGLRVAAPVWRGQVLVAPTEHRGVKGLGRLDVWGLDVRPAQLPVGIRGALYHDAHPFRLDGNPSQPRRERAFR